MTRITGTTIGGTNHANIIFLPTGGLEVGLLVDFDSKLTLPPADLITHLIAHTNTLTNGLRSLSGATRSCFTAILLMR